MSKQSKLPKQLPYTSPRLTVYGDLVEVEAVVIPPPAVTNPLAVVVDMRGFGVAVAVPIRVPVAVVMVVIHRAGTGRTRGDRKGSAASALLRIRQLK